MFLTQKQKDTLIANNEESKKIVRSCLQESLIILLESQSYETLTVTCIVKKAGVSRSAFYKNYTSKQDLFIQTIKNQVEKFVGKLNGDAYHDLNVIFSQISEHKDFVKSVFGNHLSSIVLDVLNQKVATKKYDYCDIIWTGILFNTINIWINQIPEKNVQEITNELYQALFMFSNQFQDKIRISNKMNS